MKYTNVRIGKVKPSETLAVKAKAIELKAQGRSIIDLSTGEPDIDTPEHIKDGARKALLEGKTKYTAVNGIPELREAIAMKLVRDNEIPATAETVIVTNGGKQAIYEAFQVILEPGDEVVIPAPYWVSYPPMVELAGGRPVILKTRPENSFRMTPDELRGAITKKTKCVVINSPSNPTGMGYTKEALSAFADVIREHEVLVLSDEVYEKLTYPHFQFSSFVQAAPDLADRTITVNAFSKTYSATGWRLGYATGPREIISAMGRYQSQSTSNVSSIAQYAALAALRGPHDFIKDMMETFERRMKGAIEILTSTPGLSIPGRPDGAFYLFIRFDGNQLGVNSRGTPLSSGEFVNLLLEKGGVAAVAGEAFGDDSAFRISVGASDNDVLGGVQKISQVVRELVRE